ncbi:hypothetical protein CTAYLR_007465 [Chrysophaeum taylorii]|uniref:Ankyrin repeat protein n=1 Tax=Chrysophaeum taylorii TaxID=2483200 RepID=A0AAD7XMU5_9STRA|nr:hypothetical protein CTAYLR_007465 [Chrysophaeum taylorii]
MVAKMTRTQKWFFCAGVTVVSDASLLDVRAREMVAAIRKHRRGVADLISAFEARISSEENPSTLENARELMTLWTLEGLLKDVKRLDAAKKNGTSEAVDEYARRRDVRGLPTPKVNGPAACVTMLGIDDDLLGLIPALCYVADVLGVSLATTCDRYVTGYALVHWACARGDHCHTVRWLVERGVDVDMRTACDARGAATGHTPLHIAATRLHLELCATLLALGANPNLRLRPNLHYFEVHMPNWRSQFEPAEAKDKFKGRTPLACAFTRDEWQAFCHTHIINLIDIFKSAGAKLDVVYGLHDKSEFFIDPQNANILDHAIMFADDHDDPIVLHLRDNLNIAPILEDASDFSPSY